MRTLWLLAAGAALSLSGAAGAAPITVSCGATPVPHAEVLEFVKPILAKQGVELKIIEFNDYVQPNLATDDHQIDTNYFQHRPYLESFVKEHGVKLEEVAAVHIEPMGAYSRTVKDLKALPEGATVSIPNDPTNGGRALLLLQSAGLITLEDPKSVTATPLDVKDNPKKLQFRELEAPQLPRSLDEVDAAIINTNYAIEAKLNPMADAVYLENADSPYVNILVASPESRDLPGVQALIKAINAPEVREFIKQQYHGAVVPAF